MQYGYNLIMKIKQTVINNEIVPANWFFRQGEKFWDFLYFHVFPIRTWYMLISFKDKVKYALERAFTGFDRRISWGYEYQIAFYKRMLSDLYKYAHGWPGSATAMKEICPEECKVVEEKWKDTLPEEKTLDDILFQEIPGINIKDFSEDGFQAWKKYIRRVLNYFEEADPETCSKRFELEELESELHSPFDEAKRTVVEQNGEYYYIYSSIDVNSKETKVLDKIREIEQYQIDQFKLGMNEIAKNSIYLCD